MSMYISSTSCAFFYRIDHGQIRSPVQKAAANGGKPPAGGSSPASKPRAPSEKRWKIADPWICRCSNGFSNGFSPNMGQLPWVSPDFAKANPLKLLFFQLSSCHCEAQSELCGRTFFLPRITPKVRLDSQT